MLTTTRSLQRGLTLIELMVSMALGVMVVGATVALYSVASTTSTTSNEEQGLQDSGRFALLTLASMAHMAGYINYTNDPNTPSQTPIYPAVEGADKAKVTGANDITNVGVTINRSTGDTFGDSVGFRFQSPISSDSSMVDCLGNNHVIVSKTDLGLNVFYVGTGTDSEPTLLCVSGNTSSQPLFGTAQPLIRGVETLRVVYGVDLNSDTIPDKWLTAAEVAALSIATGTVASPWGYVVAIRIGMVMRGAVGSGGQAGAQTLYPLGQKFAPAVTFSAPSDGRLRRVFNATFQMRNPPNWAS